MSSPFCSKATISVPEGHVALVLLQEGDSSFYLQIPLHIIGSLCLKPRKYLLFLAWCILGNEGILALEHDGLGIDTSGDLDDQRIYYYVPVEALDLVCAVDLEVIKHRTNVPSEPTHTCDEFRAKLLERDVCCVWTGVERYGDGFHIIPHERGSVWFQLVVENRPNYGEDVTALRDINDIRNGVFAYSFIHQGLNQRHAAILKSPNHILEIDDIPSRHERTLTNDISYPTDSRYTLQWLDPGESGKTVTSIVPNNIDAAFERNSDKPKPSDLLLHYNYGAAAVSCWGRGKDVLRKLANPPRPSTPVPAPKGTPGTTQDRSAVIRNFDEAGNPSRPGTGGLVESEGEAWDEDDVMLFFLGNTQAAKERNLKKVSESTRHIEQWREGVPQGSV